jgi:murein DD-endopeptidase MepM/ murein hydrolase activator NlpD
MSGKVIISTTSTTYGNYIMLEDGELRTVYAHCSTLLVNEGAQVTQGEVIAKSGETGNTTGPHLHFEVRINDNPINPRLILNF